MLYYNEHSHWLVSFGGLSELQGVLVWVGGELATSACKGSAV